ncbi:MAG: PRC-barrel domain-containing protein [Bradyrhizobium sp.]|nr:PRC-barrel domain-containing protein [Bradyrhizobium sp.]
MNGLHLWSVVVMAVVFTLGVMASTAHTEEVGLVQLNVKEVAKGYRASELELKSVINDKGQTVGYIDDFIFGTSGQVFVVLSVGEFVRINGQLVAVPFSSLKFNGPDGNIVLPGASRTALDKLPVFFYTH